MTRIQYAYAISGGTFIQTENEQERVCLTRSIPESAPRIDYGTDWIAAHNIITSTCEIRHAHTALATGKRKGSFLLKIQSLERAETRNTDKPRSYGEYDGTQISREDIRAEYPTTEEELTQRFDNFRGSKGYSRRTYNNGYYMQDWCAKHQPVTERTEQDKIYRGVLLAHNWYQSE